VPNFLCTCIFILFAHIKLVVFPRCAGTWMLLRRILETNLEGTGGGGGGRDLGEGGVFGGVFLFFLGE